MGIQSLGSSGVKTLDNRLLKLANIEDLNLKLDTYVKSSAQENIPGNLRPVLATPINITQATGNITTTVGGLNSYAQGFQTTSSAYISHLNLGIGLSADIDSPPLDDLLIELVSSVDGGPGTTVMGVAKFQASRITMYNSNYANFSNYDVYFDAPVWLTSGVPYFLVVSSKGSTATKYVITTSATDTYAGGVSKTSTDGSKTWTTVATDLKFTMYTFTTITGTNFTATRSIPLSPYSDFLAFTSIEYTVINPSGGTVTVDLLDSSDKVIYSNLTSGASLDIFSDTFSAVKVRVSASGYSVGMAIPVIKDVRLKGIRKRLGSSVANNVIKPINVAVSGTIATFQEVFRVDGRGRLLNLVAEKASYSPTGAYVQVIVDGDLIYNGYTTDAANAPVGIFNLNYLGANASGGSAPAPNVVAPLNLYGTAGWGAPKAGAGFLQGANAVSLPQATAVNQKYAFTDKGVFFNKSLIIRARAMTDDTSISGVVEVEL